MYPLCAQDATREMKEMVLTKPSANESPRKRRPRSARKPRSSRMNPDGDVSGTSDLKPRRLEFEEDSEGAPEDECDSPLNSADVASPVIAHAEDACLQEETPAKVKVPPADDDLFTGPFAKQNTSPREKPSSAKSKHSSTEKRRKSPKAAKHFSEVPTVPPTAAELQDEEDVKNDPILKLMDKIRENRLMSILPLNCNPNLARIHFACFTD